LEHKQIQNQAIQDKDLMMMLEVKVSQLEGDNMNKELKVKDLELINQELELKMKNILVKICFFTLLVC
jgi:hypothetical protein